MRLPDGLRSPLGAKHHNPEIRQSERILRAGMRKRADRACHDYWDLLRAILASCDKLQVFPPKFRFLVRRCMATE
jgi:hypothetical protein